MTTATTATTNEFAFCPAMCLPVVKYPVFATVVQSSDKLKSSIVPFSEKSFQSFQDKGKIFFCGYGYKKPLKKKTIQVPNLPENYTAKDLQTAYDKYGFNVVLGLLQTPENENCSFYDHAEHCSTFKTQGVLMNICVNGEDYLNTMKTIYDIGERFTEKVIKKFNLQEMITLDTFENYKSHKMRILLENAKPLSHIENFLMLTKWFSTPNLNSISMDKDISFLCRELGIEINEDNCSTRDMIVMLSDEDSAKEVESVFELVDKHNERARVQRESRMANPTIRPPQLIM